MFTLPRRASALDFGTKRQDKSATFFAWLSLCGFLAFLLPNHYSPWVSVHQEWTMAMGFVPLCVWAVWRAEAGLPVLSVAAWVLATVPLLQLAAGQIVFPGDAWLAALYLAGFGLAVLAGDRYVARQGQGLAALSDLWVAIVMACIVSMGAAMHQWLDLQRLAIFVIDLPPGGRIFANLAQPNHFATLLLLGLTGLIFLFESRRVGAPVGLAGAFLLTFGLVMTGSRSVLLAVLWFGLMYAVRAKRCKLRLSMGAVVPVIAFYFLATLAWPSINQALQLDSIPITVLDRLSPGVRTLYWQSMLDAVSQAPGLGYGWGQIPFAQQAVALAHPPTHNFFESAHNLALDLVLWNGAPLGLAVVLLLAGWFFFQFRSITDPLAWCLMLGLGCVFSHAAVELPLWYAYFLLPVGFWMGALGGANPIPLGRWRLHSPQVTRACAALVGAAALAVFVLVSAEYPGFEEDWREMQFREKRLGRPAPYAPRHPIVLSQLEALLASSDSEPRPGMTAQELDAMGQVSRRYAFASILYRYALAAGLNGDSTQAMATLRILCSLHPPRSCALARKEWAELGRTTWPQLVAIPFPDPP